MYAIIDIETGGFSVKKNGICEVAIGLYFRDGNLISSFHSLIKPYDRPDEENPNELASYKDDAMAVNEIKVFDLFFGLNLDKVLEATELIASKASVIYAHNSSFDYGFLNHYIEFNNLDLPNLRSKSKWKCTKELAKESGKFQSNKLQDIAKELRISTIGNHRAMKDVEILNEVIKLMNWHNE
jgi:DNA polymerase III epsilon subunit-like protein